MSRSNRYGKCMKCTEGVRAVGEESCTHVGDTGLSDVATYDAKLGHGLGVCTQLFIARAPDNSVH